MLPLNVQLCFKNERQTDRWPGSQAGKLIRSQKHSDTVSLQGNAVGCFDRLSNNQENQTGVWLVSYRHLVTCLCATRGMRTELQRQAVKGLRERREKKER